MADSTPYWTIVRLVLDMVILAAVIVTVWVNRKSLRAQREINSHLAESNANNDALRDINNQLLDANAQLQREVGQLWAAAREHREELRRHTTSNILHGAGVADDGR